MKVIFMLKHCFKARLRVRVKLFEIIGFILSLIHFD